MSSARSSGAIEYSFVVPLYNDHYLLEDFCAEFARVMGAYLGPGGDRRYELIVVDDGSRQFDAGQLERLCRQHPFLRAIRLSRNFGQHIAVSCGYRHAAGAYVGMLNVDMEDPPDQIPLLLDALRGRDFDIVYGLRRSRHSPLGVRLTSLAFNVALNKLTGHDVPLNVSTLRVMNRRFVDAYNSLTESSRYIPGLEMWLGFARGYVEIEHQPRRRGRSSYDFRKRLLMAFDSIISFSDLPLKLVAFGGVLVAALGLLVVAALVIAKLVLVDFEAGYPSTIAVIVALAGVQMTVVGLASLYIGRILKEVQNRPLYVIRDTFNLQRAAGAGNAVSEPAAALRAGAGDSHVR